MGKLTAVGVKNAKPGRHADGDGLYLVVKPTGSRAWMLRVQSNGRRRDFGLGSVATVSLAEARAKSQELRKLTREGGDPVIERQRKKVSIPTFGEAAEACHGEMKDGWRNTKHAAQWIQTLRTYAFPSMAAVRVDQIGSPLVRDALAPIWLAKPETAKRVHQRIGSVLDYSQSKGWRQSDTPTRSVLKGLPRQKSHDRHFAAMPFGDLPAFMARLGSQSHTIGRIALMFTILTAARSGEVRGAIWSEIDLDAKLWTIPADRMKAHREHIVPLNAPALALLAEVEPLAAGKPGNPVFPGIRGGPISDMTLSKVLRDANLPFTVHGFRSSFRDWAAEETEVPGEVVEKALAHTISNKVEAAYRRTDFLARRTKLMGDWAAFAGSPILESEKAHV